LVSCLTKPVVGHPELRVLVDVVEENRDAAHVSLRTRWPHRRQVGPGLTRCCGTMRLVSMPEALGPLRRVRQLGGSDLATVWLYRDESSGVDVAVKALADELARHEEIRRRFTEEARILR